MATLTIQATPTFAAGDTVRAYPKAAFGYYGDAPNGTSPPVAATATAVVAASGVATLAGVAAATDYLIGTGSSPYTYLRARSGTQSSSELGYAERTSDFATANTGDDIPGLSIDVTARGNPILLEFFAFSWDNNGNGGAGQVQILEGASLIGQDVIINPAASVIVRAGACHIRARITPSAGIHTYKVNAGDANVGTGTMTLRAGVGAAMFLRATESA